MEGVEIDSEVERLGNEIFERLGGNISTEVYKRNANYFGSALKNGMEAARFADIFAKCQDFAERSKLGKDRPDALEEILKDDVEALLPQKVKLSAKSVTEFFKSKEYDRFKELILFGSSEWQVDNRAEQKQEVEFLTLKLLTREAGIELSKAVGLENFRFNDSYTMAECTEMVDSINDVVSGKKKVWGN